MAPSRPSHDAPLSPDEANALFDTAFADRPAILLAISGGGDSLALLVLAAEWAADRGGPRLFAATVDHALRPEAAAEADLVASTCARLGLPHARLAGAVAAGPRLEERAREARYAVLSAHATTLGGAAVATAHTLDDQAETVLMRLAAGSGPAGLAAMRPVSERGGLVQLRPLLSVPKSRLVATLRARGVAWAEDAMNADPAFARPRLRRVRGALAREGLTPRRLGALATRMARAEDALEQAAAEAATAFLARDDKGWTLASALSARPEEIRLRVLLRAVAAAGEGPVRLARLERLGLEMASKPSGAATLAGARIAWTPDGTVRVVRAPARRPHGAKPGSEL